MLLEGLHIPLTTPFHPDGRLNLRKLAANVARYSKTPAAGLIVLGPSGEPTLLSDDETREVLRTVAEAASPEKVLTAGIDRNSVYSTLTFAEFAAGLDYDAVLIGPPSIAADDLELLAFFRSIADRSPLPVILHSTKTRSIPSDCILQLAAHPNIFGLLMSDPCADIAVRTSSIRRQVTVTSTFAAVTARMQKAASHSTAPVLISTASLTGSATAVAEPPTIPVLRTRNKSVGFQIITGATASILTNLRVGALGAAPTFAACAPQASYEVYAAWKDSDELLAAEKQARLLEAATLAEATPGTLKFGCDLNGYFGGTPRLPHLPPTGAERNELEQQMKPLRN